MIPNYAAVASIKDFVDVVYLLLRLNKHEIQVAPSVAVKCRSEPPASTRQTETLNLINNPMELFFR